MTCLTTLHTRLSGSFSSPPKLTSTTPTKNQAPKTPPPPFSTTQPPDTAPPRRRRIHGRRPSGASANPNDRGASPSPLFVSRDNRKRSASLPTPREIADSVVYAKTCSAYLCGQAESSTSQPPDPRQQGEVSEAFLLSLRHLRADFALFEADQVAWAGYLMEGSAADAGDPARARLFVQEGREIMRAVDRARGCVDRVVG